MANKTLSLEPKYDLKAFMDEGNVVGFNLGPNRELLVAIALNALDYRDEMPGWASFAKTVPKQAQRYRVLIGRYGAMESLNIEDEKYNIHDVQLVPDNRILLVCARSYYRGPGDIELNGRLYTQAGEFLDEILLGDGIQETQVTNSGVIWTSYFDEGIFGNYGWEDPIGASGLVAWDLTGKKLYEFEPAKGLDYVCDCYALNVTSDREAWCYYYTEFPLVKIKDFSIADYWDIPLSGSDSFAIYRNFALFRGGYDQKDQFFLVQLDGNNKASIIREVVLKDEQNRNLKVSRVASRGDTFLLLSGTKVFAISVADTL